MVLSGLDMPPNPPINSTCERCKKTYAYARSNRNGATRALCSGCRVTLWRRRLKQRAIDFLGGKCCICGYCKCQEGLDFHHLDPSKKEFGIGKTIRSWNRVQIELRKCILLCANCHREVEASIVNVPG